MSSILAAFMLRLVLSEASRCRVAIRQAPPVMLGAAKHLRPPQARAPLKSCSCCSKERAGDPPPSNCNHVYPFAPPNHIYGSSLNKGESLCALRGSDGSKAWCASYNQAGPALFSQGKIYLYAFKITYQGSSSSEQPAQIDVLNESDGSLAAHYSPADVTRMLLESMTLS